MSKWSKKLAKASQEFMQEIIEQVPEVGGARAAFTAILDSLSEPSKEVQDRLDKLQALENGGVENWNCYDFSMEAAGLLDDEDEEDDEDD